MNKMPRRQWFATVRLKVSLPLVVSLLLFLFAVGFATCVHLAIEVYPEDDAFITYRYVKNLLDGKGLVYNEGQRVMGSTTPLYLFWLAGLKLILPFDIPDLSVRFNLIWFILSAIALARLIRYATGEHWLGLAGACFFLLSRRMLTISLGGMESFLFTSLVLWCLERLARGRYLQAALLADLALVTRPEGVFVILICAIAWLKSKRRAPILFAGLLLGIAALWFTWAWLYFGTPIPQSIIAKAHGLYPLPVGDAFKTILLIMNDWTLVGTWGSSPVRTFFTVGVTIPAIASLLVWGKVRNLSIMILALLGMLVSFYAITNPFIFGWYLPPLYALHFIILFCGTYLAVAYLTRQLISRSASHVGTVSNLSRTGTLIVLTYFALLVANPYTALLQRNSSLTSLLTDGHSLRVPVYREIASWLNRQTSVNARIGAPEIGALGYYWHGQVLDAAGLVSPEAVAFLPVPEGERGSATVGVISNGFVRATKPDFVVTHPVFAEKSLLIDDWFQSHYELIGTFKLPIRMWKADVILVFQKQH